MKIYYFTDSKNNFTCLRFKSLRRVSIISIIAYVLDKENFLNRNFFIERIADRFGLLSPILDKKSIRDLIFINGIRISKIKIVFYSFVIGRNFIQRLLTGIILLINPSLLTLHIYMNSSEEQFKKINFDS